MRESVLVDSGERGGEGQLGEPFAAKESASADACVGDGGEVDVGERGAFGERVDVDGDEGRRECERGEGGAPIKGALADAGERGGQRELGERGASVKGASADGDEAGGEHTSAEGAAVAEGIVADEGDGGEVTEEQRLEVPAAAFEGFRLPGRGGACLEEVQEALAVARTLNHVEPRVAQLFVRDGMARGASRRESRKASHVELLGHAAEQIDWKRSERERNCSFSFRHHLFETDGRLALGCSSF